MAYNSSFNNSNLTEVCGIALCPLKTKVLGPALLVDDNSDDIISETLRYFRPNIMFKNFSVQGTH